MAEGDGTVYNIFKERLMEGMFDLVNDAVKVALVTGYSPNIDTHTVWTHASGAEVTGTGYTAGGKALAGKSVTMDTTDDEGVFDASNVTWTGLNAGTPSHAVMYDDEVTSPLVDPLMAYWIVTTPSNGGNYTLQWNTEGIINIG